MATREDKRARVHGHTPTSSQYDQHQATATASLRCLGTGQSLVFTPSKSNSGTSKPFSQSVVNTRSSPESARHNLSHTIAGSRPKQFPKTPETSNNSKTLPDASLISPKNDTDADRGLSYDSSGQCQIGINMCFEIRGIQGIRRTFEWIDCKRSDYMKWKCVMSSAANIYKCNAELKRMYGNESPITRFSGNEDSPPSKGNVGFGRNKELVVEFPLNNNEHAKQIAKQVVALICNKMELIVETYDVKEDEIEKAVEQIKKTILKIAYVDAIKTKVYVVFEDSHREQVHLALNECVYCKEKDFWKEERVPLKKKLSKFTDNIKHKLFVKSPHLSVRFQESHDSLTCILRGTETSVLGGKDMLRHSEKELKDRRVTFTTGIHLALRELYVESLINDRLNKEYSGCIAEQEQNEIHIYGLVDETELAKACLFVGGMIIECKPIPLCWDLRGKRKDIIETHFRTKFQDKLVVSVDNSWRLHLIGFEEAVNGAVKELNEIKEGRVSLPTSISCQEHEHAETEYYPIHAKVHSRFMEKSVVLKNIAEKFNVNINLQQKQYRVEIRGSRGNVQQALEELETMGNTICSEDAVFSNQQAVTFFARNHSNDYIDSVERQCDVLLEKEVVFKTDKIAVTKRLFTENIIWSDSFGRELVVEINHWDNVQTSVKVYPKVQDPNAGRRFTKNSTLITMGVPCWIDGKQSEESDLESLVTTLMTTVSEGKEKSVAMPIKPIANWPFDEYINCFVKSSVRWLLERSNDLPTLILLFTDSRDYLQRTDTYIEENVTNMLKELQNKPKTPEIRLIKGQLDQTEANVLVNTTAPNLDLSYGKVSSALLNAVGSKLQQECTDRYPKGITPDMVAVTGGYNLMCKQVFHITLPRYDGDTKNGIESIRKAMLLCLKTASDSGYETIAFPVIGTGTLLYPVDIVVSEMFGSVKRHHNFCPDTKLKEVRFVIFQKDTVLLQKFKKEREKQGHFVTESLPTLEPRCEVKIKITGMKRNVLDARVELESKAKSLDQEITDRIPDVTVTEFDVVTKLHGAYLDCLKKEGVTISHSSTKKELSVTGKVSIVGTTVVNLRKYVQDVKDMQNCEIPVDTSKEEEVYKIVSKMPPNGEVVYIYDRKASCIFVFARTKEVLERALGDLQIKLKYRGQYTRQEEAMDTSDDRQLSLGKGASLYKPNITRKFSLSKDVNNLNVYENGNLVIRVYEANIIHVPADGIVNAANQDLNHIGGVARVIAKAAGETLLRECEHAILNNKGPLNVSAVVPTTAGNLHFKYVIHAVGPRWSDYKPVTEGSLKQCSDDLKHTITSCLMMAESKQLESIVMSTISSGAFGVPREICAEQYARAILEFGGKNKSLREIHIVDNNHEMIDIVHKTFSTMINERKPTPFTLSVYVEQSAGQATLTDEGNKNTDDRRNFKCTGRDRPNSTTDFIREELLYKSYGDKLVCSFASSNEVQVYAGDILHLDGIPAVVCSETSKGDAKGNISKILLEKGGTEYRRNKETQFGSHRNIGEVITTKGGRNKYTWIIHALVSKEDLNILAGLYRQIFEEAKTRELQAIALPLLGTAGEIIGPVGSTQTLFNEWIQFCQKNTKFGLTLHLVINEEVIADIVKDVFKRCIDEMKQKINDTDRVHLPKEQSTKPSSDVVNENLTAADEDCVICMDKVTDAKKLKCGHTFCTECIEGYFRVKMVCPTCGKVCGTITGDQPDGTMEISKSSRHVTGFERHKSIVITYRFISGQQGPDHPNPGAVYKGIARSAYLPDTTEGREICAMLKVAFERRLVFTIGSSRTTGQEGVITWNDIHHKTDMRPNTQFGYPDDTYLQRVREELEVKGVTGEDVETKFIKQLGKDYFRQTVN